MKKAIGFIVTALILLIGIPDMVITAQAEAVTIPSGNYTINADGEYQLASDYSGVITVASSVYEVTVVGAVYSTHHDDTSIVLEVGRTDALELTIKDLNIKAPNGQHGISFWGAGNYSHKLLISGKCSVDGYINTGIFVPAKVQLTMDKAADVKNDEDACLAVIGGSNKAGINVLSGGTITIAGGTVTATGGDWGAGIGGNAYENSVGTIIINGGNVTAATGTRGVGAAGIGSGASGKYKTINIGGEIIINGGTVKSTGGGWGAGIGGNEHGVGGIITINGGTVEATGGIYAAGIGGGSGGSCDTITINGGNVTAATTSYTTGKSTAAGIGGGGAGACGTIIINDGTVTAAGGEAAAGIGSGKYGASGVIRINGGTVTATGDGQGSGIGSGAWLDEEDLAGTITITGGKVNATGFGGGAGIGGGLRSNGDIITITGGTIIANSNTMDGYGAGGAGIGSGYESKSSTINISGGNVTATSRSKGAGIGGGDNVSGGNINISGGTVTAVSELWGAGIGGGWNGNGGSITISGGTVAATSNFAGAGIGGGYNGNGGSINIYGAAVKATGGAAGIGGGQNGSGGIINISGGSVTATGGYRRDGNYAGYGTTDGGAGIGGGQNGDGEAITIREAEVTATGGRRAAGIGGGIGGSGSTVIVSSSSVVTATGDTEGGAEHIGKGKDGSASGTLKDSFGADLSYLRFSAEDTWYGKLADVKIKISGIEGVDGVYQTNEQGIFWIFAPYTKDGEYSYKMNKAGYSAVEGSKILSSVSHDINVKMKEDNMAPNINNVTPLAMQTGIPIVVDFNDDYGIYGTLYLVPKAKTIYTSKVALDEVAIRKIDVINHETSKSIGTEGLKDGSYQVYFVDSAENLSAPTDIVIDNISPTVSNINISIANTTKTRTTLTWNKAKDLGTLVTELKYCVYQLPKDNINTVAEIEANGTVKQDYTEDISESSITGLQPGTTYYFNVIVKDNAGNKACYNKAAVTTRATSDRDGNSNTISNASSAAQNPNEKIIPVSKLRGAAGKTVEIRTELAVVTVPSNMLTNEAAGNAATAVLRVSRADTAKLSAEVQAQIGSKPVIELSLKLDGKTIVWNNPDAPVTVAIPYQPTAEELANPEHITVWYIDGKGNIFSVPSGRYNPETGMVTFTTTHFSRYAVVYVKKSFNDLESHAWAKKQIEVLASKGIMKGRTDEGFAPQAGITREEYIGALVRTLGVTAKVEGGFSDVKKDSSWYNEITIAKKLGITNGTGNNSFKPEENISRQDMMVLTERALRNMKRLNITGTAADLERFKDRTELADYAVGSIASLVKEGLLEGSNGKLNVEADTTRAEAAVFLYRIYNK